MRRGSGVTLVWEAVRMLRIALGVWGGNWSVMKSLARVASVAVFLCLAVAMGTSQSVEVTGMIAYAQGPSSATSSEPAGNSPGNSPIVIANSGAGDGSSSAWLFVLLTAMSVAVAVLSATTFYLYKWRKILLSSPHLAVPEDVAKYLKSLGGEISDFGKELSELGSATVAQVNHVRRIYDQTDSRVLEMTEAFRTYQNALDEKDTEIRRLKTGHDYHVFKSFVTRFIRLDITLREFCSNPDIATLEMKQIKRLLEDALEECGIESYQPDIGADYRIAVGVADNPRTIAASSKDEEFRIAEVAEPGYVLKQGQDPQVIMPAKVIIYI